jgi:RimJ/RimL family protein N-acetyltransferase
MIEVRLAGTGDIPAMVDIYAAVAAEGLWIAAEAPIDRERRALQFAATIDGEGDAFVAVADGEVVGHLGLHRSGRGAVDLGMLVADRWRGRGVGTALLAKAIEWARAEPDVHKLALEVWPHNGAARALYRRLGFVDEGRLRRQYRRRSGELWDAIVMGLVVDETSPGSPYEDA